jgi:SAM-dependent MidA family methyltransferase
MIYSEKIEGVKAFELIPQQFFLEAMGIENRVENLSKGLAKAKL